MEENKILKQFRESNALLEGHFILSSGLHSANYLQCALALQNPIDAKNYGRAIAKQFTAKNIATVAAPAIGGLVIGFAVAQALNARFLWTERQNGEMTLRRGFSVNKNERVLVVEDVITTGGSVKECIQVLKNQGAEVVFGASIVDRSDGEADIGVQRFSLLQMKVPTYTAEDCPMCAEGSTPVKPGSREN
ncbi:MAG: orotate phosphoribosyltransferase [Pyrinomonadaceae bacterium]